MSYLLIDDLGRCVGKIITSKRLPHKRIAYGGTRDGVKEVVGLARIVPACNLRMPSWAIDNYEVDTYDINGYLVSRR
jgi:hypothetical protein